MIINLSLQLFLRLVKPIPGVLVVSVAQLVSFGYSHCSPATDKGGVMHNFIRA